MSTAAAAAFQAKKEGKNGAAWLTRLHHTFITLQSPDFITGEKPNEREKLHHLRGRDLD